MTVTCPRPNRDNARVGMIPLDRIRVHHRNVRQALTGLEELAASIRHDGVLVPLMAHQKYQRGPGVPDLELLHGHRRLAAAEIAGLRRVPVVVVPYHEDDAALVLMLAENTRRAELTGPDRARAVRDLIEEFGYTSTALAERLGISVAELGARRQGAGRRTGASHAQGSGDPAPPRRRAPSSGPRAVHTLLASCDTGALTPAGLVEELRAALAGWSPAGPPPSRLAAPTTPAGGAEVEPDWAEVEQLLGGSRRAGTASPGAYAKAVRRLTEQGLSAAQIGDRIGLSARHVVRYRALAAPATGAAS